LTAFNAGSKLGSIQSPSKILTGELSDSSSLFSSTSFLVSGTFACIIFFHTSKSAGVLSVIYQPRHFVGANVFGSTTNLNSILSSFLSIYVYQTISI
jgi:hypothetical protein